MKVKLWWNIGRGGSRADCRKESSAFIDICNKFNNIAKCKKKRGGIKYAEKNLQR